MQAEEVIKAHFNAETILKYCVKEYFFYFMQTESWVTWNELRPKENYNMFCYVSETKLFVGPQPTKLFVGPHFDVRLDCLIETAVSLAFSFDIQGFF